MKKIEFKQRILVEWNGEEEPKVAEYQVYGASGRWITIYRVRGLTLTDAVDKILKEYFKKNGG